MEVSGKIAAEDLQLYCHACYRDDDSFQPAHGFCQDCQEHLCESCFNSHKKPSPCRHHVLLDKETMPKIQQLSAFTPSDELEFCPKHVNERLKFYCTDHDVAACGVCNMDHRLCEVVYVPDAARNITGSEEYREQVAQLNLLREKCSFAQRHVRDVMKGTELNLGNILDEISEVREKLNGGLNEIEKEVKQYMNRDTREIQKMDTACGEILEEVDEIESSTGKLVEHKHLNKLFIEMKKTRGRIKTLLSKGEDVRHSYEIPTMKMLRDESFVHLLKEKLVSTDNKDSLTLQYKDTIPVKEIIGKTTCFIDGIELASTDKLIAIGSDCQNHSVMLMDLERKQIISEMELPSEPHDITSMSGNHFAVTLRNGIQILSLGLASVSPDRYVETNEQLYGIAFWQDRFVVSCNRYPGKVMILDPSGAVLNEFFASGSLYHPRNIAVNYDGKSFNVTDVRHTVTQIDWTGNVISVYRQDGCYGPRDIQALTGGTFLTCFHGSNKLALTSNTNRMCEMTGLSNTEIWKPHALRYCGKSEKLYLLCASDENKFADIIRIFDAKWQTGE